MKKSGFFILGILLLCAACSAPDKVLHKQDGTWELYELSTTAYIDGIEVHDTITYDQGMFTFDKNGNGTWTQSGLDQILCVWEYDNQDNVVTVTLEGAIAEEEYSVLESSRDTQVWFSNQTVRVGGIVHLSEHVTRLRKVE